MTAGGVWDIGSGGGALDGEIISGILFAGMGLASASIGAVLVGRLRRGIDAVGVRPHSPVTWNGSDLLGVFCIGIACQAVASAAVPMPAVVFDQIATHAVAMSAATSLGIAYLLLRGAAPESLGFGVESWRQDLGLAAIAFGLILAPLLATAGLLDRLVPYEHPVIDFLHAHDGLQAILLVALSAVVVAPVAEEFFFRRVLQGWLERDLGGPIAIAVSALAFGLAHMGQGLAWMPLVLFGLVAGYLARQTGSIVPGILLHALFNAASLLLVLAQMASRSPAGS